MSKSAAALIGVLAIIGAVLYGALAHVLTIQDSRSSAGDAFALGSLYLLAVTVGWASRWRPAIVVLATVAVIA